MTSRPRTGAYHKPRYEHVPEKPAGPVDPNCIKGEDGVEKPYQGKRGKIVTQTMRELTRVGKRGLGCDLDQTPCPPRGTITLEQYKEWRAKSDALEAEAEGE